MSMNPADRTAVTAAARAITRAAQNYRSAADAEQRRAMTDAIAVHTDKLDRTQLLAVIADLATLLAIHYGSDPLAADAAVTDEQLAAWLAG